MIKKIAMMLLVLSAILAGCAKKQNPYPSTGWSFQEEQALYMVLVYYGDDTGTLIAIRGDLAEERIGCSSEFKNGKIIVTVDKPLYKVIEFPQKNNLLLIDQIKGKITELKIDKMDSDYIKHLMKNKNEVKSLFLRAP